LPLFEAWYKNETVTYFITSNNNQNADIGYHYQQLRRRIEDIVFTCPP